MLPRRIRHIQVSILLAAAAAVAGAAVGAAFGAIAGSVGGAGGALVGAGIGAAIGGGLGMAGTLDGMNLAQGPIVSPDYVNASQTIHAVSNPTVEYAPDGKLESRWSLEYLQLHSSLLTEYITQYDHSPEVDDSSLTGTDGLHTTAEEKKQGLMHAIERYVATRKSQQRERETLCHASGSFTAYTFCSDGSDDYLYEISMDDFMQNYIWEENESNAQGTLVEMTSLLSDFYGREISDALEDGIKATMDKEALGIRHDDDTIGLDEIGELKWEIYYVDTYQVEDPITGRPTTISSSAVATDADLAAFLSTAEKANLETIRDRFNLHGKQAKESDLIGDSTFDKMNAAVNGILSKDYGCTYTTDADCEVITTWYIRPTFSAGYMEGFLDESIKTVDNYQEAKNSQFDDFLDKLTPPDIVSGSADWNKMADVSEAFGLLTHNIVSTHGTGGATERTDVFGMLDDVQNEYRAWIEEQRAEAKRTAYNQITTSLRRHGTLAGGYKDDIQSTLDKPAAEQEEKLNRDLRIFIRRPEIPKPDPSDPDTHWDTYWKAAKFTEDFEEIPGALETVLNDTERMIIATAAEKREETIPYPALMPGTGPGAPPLSDDTDKLKYSPGELDRYDFELEKTMHRSLDAIEDLSRETEEGLQNLALADPPIHLNELIDTDPSAGSAMDQLFEIYIKPIMKQGRLEYNGELTGDLAVRLVKVDNLTMDVVEFVEQILRDPVSAINNLDPDNSSVLLEADKYLAKLRELDNTLRLFDETRLKRVYTEEVLEGNPDDDINDGLADMLDFSSVPNVGKDKIVHVLDFVSQQWNSYVDVARAMLTEYDILRKQHGLNQAIEEIRFDLENANLVDGLDEVHKINPDAMINLHVLREQALDMIESNQSVSKAIAFASAVRYAIEKELARNTFYKLAKEDGQEVKDLDPTPYLDVDFTAPTLTTPGTTTDITFDGGDDKFDEDGIYMAEYKNFMRTTIIPAQAFVNQMVQESIPACESNPDSADCLKARAERNDQNVDRLNKDSEYAWDEIKQNVVESTDVFEEREKKVYIATYATKIGTGGMLLADKFQELEEKAAEWLYAAAVRRAEEGVDGDSKYNHSVKAIRDYRDSYRDYLIRFIRGDTREVFSNPFDVPANTPIENLSNGLFGILHNLSPYLSKDEYREYTLQSAVPCPEPWSEFACGRDAYNKWNSLAMSTYAASSMLEQEPNVNMFILDASLAQESNDASTPWDDRLGMPYVDAEFDKPFTTEMLLTGDEADYVMGQELTRLVQDYDGWFDQMVDAYQGGVFYFGNPNQIEAGGTPAAATQQSNLAQLEPGTVRMIDYFDMLKSFHMGQHVDYSTGTTTGAGLESTAVFAEDQDLFDQFAGNVTTDFLMPGMFGSGVGGYGLEHMKQSFNTIHDEVLGVYEEWVFEALDGYRDQIHETYLYVKGLEKKVTDIRQLSALSPVAQELGKQIFENGYTVMRDLANDLVNEQIWRNRYALHKINAQDRLNELLEEKIANLINMFNDFTAGAFDKYFGLPRDWWRAIYAGDVFSISGGYNADNFLRDVFAQPLGISFDGSDAARERVYEEIGYLTLHELTEHSFEAEPTEAEVTLFAMMTRIMGEGVGPFKYFDNERAFETKVVNYLRNGGEADNTRKTPLEILGEWLEEGFISDKEFFEYLDPNKAGGTKDIEQIISIMKERSIFGEDRFNQVITGSYDGIPIVTPLRGTYAKKMEELKRKFILAGRSVNSQGEVIWPATLGADAGQRNFLMSDPRIQQTAPVTLGPVTVVPSVEYEFYGDGYLLNRYNNQIVELAKDLCKNLLNDACNNSVAIDKEFSKLFGGENYVNGEWAIYGRYDSKQGVWAKPVGAAVENYLNSSPHYQDAEYFLFNYDAGHTNVFDITHALWTELIGYSLPAGCTSLQFRRIT